MRRVFNFYDRVTPTKVGVHSGHIRGFWGYGPQLTLGLQLFLTLTALITFALPAAAGEKETASERVARTNVIRCAYGATKPNMYKDLQTGEMKGIYTEILQEAAKLLSLTIEWAGEPGYAEFAEGLRSGRYDAFCAPVGIVPSRARVSISAIPLMYNPQFIYTRADYPTLKKEDNFNRAEIKAGTTDGESFQIMTRRFLPNATEHSLPNMTPPSMLFMDVALGKADVVIHDPVLVNDFNQENKDKYQLVQALKTPLSVTPTTAFTVLPSETHLLNMFNVAFQTLLDNGKVEEILIKYNITPDVLYRVAKPYEVPQ